MIRVMQNFIAEGTYWSRVLKLPCTAKLLIGKTLLVVHHSLENFRGTSGHGHHVLYTASDSRAKLSRSSEKLQKFYHSKVLPCTVYNYAKCIGRDK